jgi:cell division septum initiation protein DivIVA
MAQGHRDPPGDGPAAPRAEFDVVARGYEPGQVDGYVRALWRYCADLTARVAAAEAALRHERDRRSTEVLTDPGQVGVRIGRMLAIAQQMGDEIVGGARLTAEQTLYDAVRDAGATHPIVQEARKQADKLLADAAAEARRLAEERHEDLEAKIAEAAASLEAVRRQQGELLGALLRLRGMVGSGDFERTVAQLARTGADPRLADAAPDAATPASAQRPAAGQRADAAQPRTGPGGDGAAPPQRESPSGPAAGARRPAGTQSGGPLPGAGDRRRATAGAFPAGADVLDGELYPVDATPVSPPTGPRRVADQEIIDVEIVPDGDAAL